MMLRMPYRGKIRFTSPFGSRVLNGREDFHGGIDLVGVDEKIVRAPCAGTVGISTILYREFDATRTWEWGNYVRIDTDDGLRVYLCHLAERSVTAGQRVEAGDPVGIEGQTGLAYGSHLHLEVRANGLQIDPCPCLGIENRAGTELDGLPMPTWYQEAAEWAVREGIVEGVGDGNMAWETPCTRAMIVTILHRFYKWIRKMI